MLNFLFFLSFRSAYHKLFNIVGASYPIDRDFCAANLNGFKYDFTPMKLRNDTYFDSTESFTYYISICDELSADFVKIPVGFQFDLHDVFVARCNTTVCQSLITENAWDWRYLDANNKEKGVIYYAVGEPFKNGPDAYFSFDIEVRVSCDSSTDPYVSPKIIYDHIDTNEALLKMVFANRYGCGTIVPTPAPTPQFKPNCDYTDRIDSLVDMGVDIHLQDMNGGPWGVRSYNMSINSGSTKDAILFYQPCERMKCPPGYTCDDPYSSAWICNEKGPNTCESYGLINNDKFIEPAYDDLLDGINFTYKKTGKSLTVLVNCNNVMPKNHFIFDGDMTKAADKVVVKARAKNGCPIPIPDPTPQPDSQCVFNNTNVQQKSNIFLNLTAHDKGDMHGWNSTVTWNFGGIKTGTLIYEPCDNAVCPKDAFCEGDEDGTVFLCETGSDGKPDCIGYGLLENRISMYFQSSYDITEGVKVDYFGDFQRSAFVTWKCDRNLKDGQIIMPSEVTLGTKSQLYFTVYSKAACGSGNPTPKPPYHPPRPTRPPEPTPTPQPSVNPTDIYVINSTHYILTPLMSYQQKIFRGNVTLMGPSPLQGLLYCEFHPWTQIPCPAGYECSEGPKESNFWACWIEDNGNKYCHSIGDVRILNEMNPRGGDPDTGAELHFGGVWGLDVYFDIECDPLEDNYSIPFDRATVIRYNQGGLSKPHFMMYLDSGAVCSREFAKIPTPPPAPYQTPKPDYKPEYTYESAPDKDGKVIKIDLSGLPVMYDELITVGLHPNFQRNLYRYYPVSPGLPPSGYTVLDSNNNQNGANDNRKANIWRCFNASDGKPYCHTAGDSTVNLIYSLIDSKELKDGISLNYEGGYGGYETHVQLICNESVPRNKIDFDDVGFFVPSTKSPIIFAHTAMACLVDAGPTPITHTSGPTSSSSDDDDDGGDGKRSAVTGGSVFLIIVIAGIILYVAIGLMVSFIKEGVIAIPNAEFWQEFAQCVTAGATFIVTCGKKSSLDISYEKVI